MHHSPHHTFAHFFKQPSLAPYLFALSKKMQDGHICLDLNELPTDEVFWKEFEGDYRNRQAFPNDSELIASSSDEKKPFVLANNKLYLNRDFFYETQVLKGLKKMVADEQKEVGSRKKEMLSN